MDKNFKKMRTVLAKNEADGHTSMSFFTQIIRHRPNKSQ